MAGDVKSAPSEIMDLDPSEPTAEANQEELATCLQEMTALKIDPEFEALLPPLTKEEYSALKEDIQMRNCRDPLIVWKDHGIIVDGHNRKKICDELGLRYKIEEIEFPSRNDVKIWMIKNQIGKRNLDESQRAMIAVTLEALYGEQAKERMGTRTDLGKKLDQSEVGRSAEKAAKDMNVSHQTVSSAKKVTSKGIPELIKLVESGNIKVSAASKVASLNPESQQMVVEEAEAQIKEGRRPKIKGILSEITPKTSANDPQVSEDPSRITELSANPMQDTDILKNIYELMKFIPKCKKCGQHFPIYRVSDADWRKSGFGSKKICRECLEKKVPEPHYYTLSEYKEKCLINPGKSQGEIESTYKLLTSIWDMPAERDWQRDRTRTESR